MKRPLLAPGAAAIALALQLLCSGSLSADPVEMTVVKVEDGDTLLVTIDGLKKRVQLAGIDAPESVSNPKLTRDSQRTGLAPEQLLPLGRAATEHLQDLVRPGDKVRTSDTPAPPDRYGRIPAVITGRGDRSLSAAMIEGGYAIALDGPALEESLASELKRLEEAAVSEGRGLWGSHAETALKWRGH